MHSAANQEKLKRLDEALNAISNTRELLQLALSEAATLNRSEWVLIFGRTELIPAVRAAVARHGVTHFDLEIYEACAHENLRLDDAETFEEFFKPFCRKAPVNQAWFTTGWELIPSLVLKREFLIAEEFHIDDHVIHAV